MPDLPNQLTKCVDLFQVTNVSVRKRIHRWFGSGNRNGALGQPSRIYDDLGHICILTEIETVATNRPNMALVLS
jgi:hypothetical protein